jgi:hypothetical protein
LRRDEGGSLGRTDQIPELLVEHPVEAEFPTQLSRGWKLVQHGSFSTNGDIEPLQAYMSFVEQWQKACTNAAASWLQMLRWPNMAQPVALPRGMS